MFDFVFSVGVVVHELQEAEGRLREGKGTSLYLSSDEGWIEGGRGGVKIIS